MRFLVLLLQFLRKLLVYPLFLLRKNKVAFSSRVEPYCFLRDTRIGKHSYLGRNCVVNSADIGNYTCIAAHTQIGGMEHPVDELSISPLLVKEMCIFGKRTTIGNDVWIGASCVIKQGVTIGDGAIIGANSFVNKDVLPYSIVLGSPAKFYRYRAVKSLEDTISQSGVWNMSPRKARSILSGLSQ